VLAVPGVRVTLHRVGSDREGPLDSTVTDERGRYAFRYDRTGASDAVYFAAASRDGVAYFTLPLQPGAEHGDDAVITVFDTTSRPVPISIRGHHVIVERPAADGSRRVTEVFEISNDSSVTRVARGDSPRDAVWSAILPPGAEHPVVREGDVPAAAVRFAGGRMLVYAPFAPGLRQVAYTYSLSPDAFPLKLPLQQPTAIVEVLLEESAARATAPGLTRVQPAPIEGRDFQRYLGRDAPASGVITIHIPDPAPSVGTSYVALLTLVIGGAMTWALARALRRR